MIEFIITAIITFLLMRYVYNHSDEPDKRWGEGEDEKKDFAED